MQTGDTGADLVTKFISISIAVMQTTAGMTELQVTRVAFASNELPTELVVRQYVTHNAGTLLYTYRTATTVSKQRPTPLLCLSSCSCLLRPSFVPFYIFH
jgi:hypothetical protein